MAAERRVFFALWPDGKTARQFEEAGRKARGSLGGRSMRRETLHLTLAFIGGIAPERLADLRAIAGSIRVPPFELLFDRLQCIPGKKIAWACASLAPSGLLELASLIHQRLKAGGFRTEARPFAAHVTLLRNAVCPKDPYGQSLRIEWSVRDFALVESVLAPEGARYRILARWSLRQT